METKKYIVFLKHTAMLLAFTMTFIPMVCLANDPPINIEADKMVSRDKPQIVTFFGNVDAKQGDVRIRSDKMTIHYMKNETADKDGKKSVKLSSGKKGSQDVEKIVCEGNVEVTSPDWLGTSDVMHYYSKKSLVQLIGNAKAYQGQNLIQGERIDHHLDTGKSEVYGRVNTTFGSTDTEKKEEKKRVNMTILQQ